MCACVSVFFHLSTKSLFTKSFTSCHIKYEKKKKKINKSEYWGKKCIMALNGEKNNNKQSTKTIIECSTKKTNSIITKSIFCIAWSVCLALALANLCCLFAFFGHWQAFKSFYRLHVSSSIFFSLAFDEKMSTPFGDC